MDNPSFIWQLIQAGGAGGVLSLGLWLVLTGRLRLEREYLDMRAQRDEWKDEALESRQVTKEAASELERVVSRQSPEVR